MFFSSTVFTGLLAVGIFPGQTLASTGSRRSFQKPSLCPSSCTSYDPSEWFVYPRVSRVAWCNESMILDFNIHSALEDPQKHSTIYACTAGNLSQLDSGAEQIASAQTTKISVNYQLAGWSAMEESSGTDTSTALLTDLKSYLRGNVQKSEIFAYSNEVAIGAHIGGSLQLVENVDLAFEKLVGFIESSSYIDTVFQFCGGDSNHTVGVAVNMKGDFSTVQNYVQSWHNGECVSGAPKNVSATGELWRFDSSSISSSANSTLSMRSQRSRTHHNGLYSHSHTHRRRSTCSYLTAKSGDTCTSLISKCGITSAEFYEYNTAPGLCSPLPVGQTVCCSSGSPPNLSPSAYDNGTCFTYHVQSGDSCSDLASEFSLTTDEIDSYNNATWAWFGCNNLQAGQSMCLSTGNPPYPLSIANAECGPQVPNTIFTSDDSSTWGELNPCPLNACCDAYGQCGTTPQYCSGYNETSTNPPGTDNCISNCGSTITNWAVPPSSYSKVGYYEASSVNRSCLQMDPLSIDTSQWTHVNFAFGNIESDFSINVNGMEDQFEHFLELSDVKRLISFGGWDFSTGPDTYMIFRNGVKSANRATFAKNVAAFVEETGLDGVDFDWEYPSEPDIEGIPAGSDDEADNYLEFLKEIKDVLPNGSLLSMTLPSSYWYLKPFPVSNMSDVVDFFNYMTYDMHGTWDDKNAYSEWGCESGDCLFSHVNMTETMWALSMLTKAGVATNQIMVGVTSYGRSFEMTTAGCYESYCTWDAAGAAGPCTDTVGYISNAEINDVLSTNSDAQLISTNVTDILVYNTTQWVGYMTNKTKVSRQAYYETYNFGGTSEWAIDLEKFVSYDNSSASAVETGGQTITIDPKVWTEATPAVTCAPPCYMIMPPQSLSSKTTMTFPQWNTHITWRATETKTTTFSDGSVMTYASYSSYVVPTSLSISPVQTNYINVWNQQISLGQTAVYQTRSIEPPPFPVTFTPTVGGSTTVVSGTTSTMPAQTFSYGNLTFTSTAWTGVFGGTTSVMSGTTLSPTTSTVTPQPYPTKLGSRDIELNTRTTTLHASTKSGSSGPKATSGSHIGTHCALFCWGCPFCPPGFGTSIDGGGGSSGDGSSDGNGDPSSSESMSSSTSTDTSSGAYINAAGAAATAIADAFPTTIDGSANVEAVATKVKQQFQDNYAAEQSSLTAGIYASVYSTSAPLCSAVQDPDSGDVGTWCTCSGSTDKIATMTGSSPCDYALVPTGTSALASSTIITTVIVETITSTSTTSSSLGRFDVAAESKLLDEPIPEKHTFYDLNWVSATVTQENACAPAYGSNIGTASPTATTWSDIPQSVSFDATFTINDETYSDCIYTNSAAPSAGDGGTVSCSGTLLACATFEVGVQYCDQDNTKILPLVSCPVTAAAHAVHTYTTTEISKYTSY